MRRDREYGNQSGLWWQNAKLDGSLLVGSTGKCCNGAVFAAAMTGPSGSGKTTLICGLIRHYVRAGRTVGAVKHTHHPVNEEDRGDTRRFREAGADPVILAGNDDAVMFSAAKTTRFRYTDPAELLARCASDIVLVEGFKRLQRWPAIRLDEAARLSAEEAAAKLDRIWTPMVPATRYRAVLFDLDGTLVDSYRALTEAVNHARRTHELDELSTIRIRELVGEGVERLLQKAFERTEVPATVFEAFESKYDEICCGESRILDEVERTLEELSALGVEMAVCTNKPTSFSQKIVDYLGIGRHFRAVVGPDLAGARKPDPRHLLYSLGTIGHERSEALFVGDMTVDIEAGRNSGIDVAVIATGSSDREELERAKPDFFLERFSDLIRIVRSEAA